MVFHPQYADDTLISEEISIKTLRFFEVSSGIYMIFANSRLIGVNFYPDSLAIVIGFLHYKHENIPFKYITLLVDVDPRKESILSPCLAVFLKVLIHEVVSLLTWMVKWFP